MHFLVIEFDLTKKLFDFILCDIMREDSEIIYYTKDTNKLLLFF